MGDRQVLSMRRASSSSSPDAALINNHFVQFYESETYLITVVAGFLRRGFADGNPMIVIATREHQAAFMAALRQQGFDVASAIASQQLTQLDAFEALEGLMGSTMPDPKKFFETVGA